jgi:hypothetical protein
MKITSQYEKLETAVQLLDGIKYFNEQAEYYDRLTKADAAYHFPKIRLRFEHKADIYKRSSERLRQRYSRLIGTLGLVLVLFFGACAPALHPADMRFNKQIINQHSAVKPLKVKHCER